MPSLLDLLRPAGAVDAAESPAAAQAPSLGLMDPQKLYELWERQQWQSHAIDFGRDRRDWAALPADLRERLSWNLAGFFIGEERVTNELSGLVMACESQSESAFLCTQQVDEARHTQHFNRFYEEVIGVGGEFEDRLARARADLSRPFLEMFDGLLPEWGRRLAEEPRDVEAKIDFVVLYHMLIEGILALTGQWFLTDFVERRGILPGWLEGFRLISRDEHRHVAYGTWLLREKAEDPALRRRITSCLAELIPLTHAVLAPGRGRPGHEGTLGWTIAETDAFAFDALRRRLRLIGIDPASLIAAAA